MNNTKTIETKIKTPFGDLRKVSIYTPTAVKVNGGIYLSDREAAKDDLVIEELFATYLNGQSFGEIIINDKTVSFDIIFDFKDTNDEVILPQDMNIPLLYNIIYNEVMGLGITEFCTYEVKIEYFLDEKIIKENPETNNDEREYVPTLGKCKLKKEKACAYCNYHNCYLSAKQIRNRECINKNCQHLQKIPNPFWENQGQYLSDNANKGENDNE